MPDNAAKNSSAADREKIQTEIKQLQAQLEGGVNNVTYAGANLLATDASEDGDFSVISSYNRDSDGGVSTGAIKFELAATRLIDTDEDADTDGKQGILDKVYTVVEADNPADTVGAPASVLKLDVSVLGEDKFDFELAGLEMALKDMTSAASTPGAARPASTCRSTSSSRCLTRSTGVSARSLMPT